MLGAEWLAGNLKVAPSIRDRALPSVVVRIVGRDQACRQRPNVTARGGPVPRATGLEAAHWHAVKLAYQMRYHLPDDDYCWTIEIKDTRGETLEIFVPSFANRKRLALK